MNKRKKTAVYDYSKLLGRIAEKQRTRGECAVIAGMSKTSIYKKLASKTEFTQGEILDLAIDLDIPLEEVGAYFFTLKVT